MAEERPRYARDFALILMDIAANELAIRKLLYDAEIADETSFGEAYRQATDRLLPIRLALETEDLVRVLDILSALLKTSTRIQ